MMNRRKLGLAFMAGIAALASTASASLSQIPVSTEEAQGAIDAFIDALVSGDPARIEAILAPEFQVLRGDGKSHDREAYLKALPTYKVRPSTSDLKVTSHESMLVVSIFARVVASWIAASDSMALGDAPGSVAASAA